MKEFDIELVHEVLEMSVGRFAGMHSDANYYIPHVFPKGMYVLDGDTLSRTRAGVIPQEIGAVVHLNETGAGGRGSATPEEKWRCSLRVGGQSLDCQMYLGSQQSLEPGGSASVRIRLLVPSKAALLPLGTEFEIWENRVVGSGRVRILL